jgi:hypothetical protein
MRLLHRSVRQKLSFNHSWKFTTTEPKHMSNRQRPERETQSDHFSRTGPTKYFQTESPEEPVLLYRTYGHTFFQYLARFLCVTSILVNTRRS